MNELVENVFFGFFFPKGVRACVWVEGRERVLVSFRREDEGRVYVCEATIGSAKRGAAEAPHRAGVGVPLKSFISFAPSNRKVI